MRSIDTKTVLAAAAKACRTFGGRAAAQLYPVQLCTDSRMHAGTLFAQICPPLQLCTMAACTNTYTSLAVWPLHSDCLHVGPDLVMQHIQSRLHLMMWE